MANFCPAQLTGDGGYGKDIWRITHRYEDFRPWHSEQSYERKRHVRDIVEHPTDEGSSTKSRPGNSEHPDAVPELVTGKVGYFGFVRAPAGDYGNIPPFVSQPFRKIGKHLSRGRHVGSVEAIEKYHPWHRSTRRN